MYPRREIVFDAMSRPFDVQFSGNGVVLLFSQNVDRSSCESYESVSELRPIGRSYSKSPPWSWSVSSSWKSTSSVKLAGLHAGLRQFLIWVASPGSSSSREIEPA